MSAKVPLKNTGSLLQLKEQLDEIVFNYIDTSQKWEVAYAKLDELLKSATVYFDSYMKANGDLPKEDTTAILFLNVSYKLIYFHTISYYHLTETQQEEVKDHVLELLILAAECIQDVHKENHAEYVHEIAKSYEEISQVKGSQIQFEKTILEKNNSVADCFESFAKAAKLFIKS